MTIFAVAFGGAAGAVSRYVAGAWVQEATGGTYPWGTLAVNVAGSLALGFLIVWLQAVNASDQTRHLLTVGFLGSFTTFSTFSYETLLLARDGSWARAGGYAAASLLLGLAAAAFGAWMATLTRSAA